MLSRGPVFCAKRSHCKEKRAQYTQYTLTLLVIQFSSNLLTFGQSDSGILSVHLVEYALIPNLRLGNEANLAANERSSRAHVGRRCRSTTETPRQTRPAHFTSNSSNTLLSQSKWRGVLGVSGSISGYFTEELGAEGRQIWCNRAVSKLTSTLSRCQMRML